jgi:hypothetical protein
MTVARICSYCWCLCDHEINRHATQQVSLYDSGFVLRFQEQAELDVRSVYIRQLVLIYACAIQ